MQWIVTENMQRCVDYFTILIDNIFDRNQIFTGITFLKIDLVEILKQVLRE